MVFIKADPLWLNSPSYTGSVNMGGGEIGRRGEGMKLFFQVSGARKERFCYCSSHLCNSCPFLQPWGRAVGILALIALVPVVTGW